MEVPPTVRRGRPGRRSVEDRVQAVLELLSGKATVDQLAFRFGVRAATVEGWRQEALEAMGTAMRQGTGATPRERALEKKLRGLERAFTDLAIRNELAERALSERPTRPGRSF
jgi:transposase-like protein